MDIAENRPDDIAALWNAAVAEYTRNTGDDLFQTSDHESRTIDNVLAFTKEKNARFSKWRHDDTKWSRFRTALGKCLGPLNGLSDFIAPYASGASVPSQCRHIHGGLLLDQSWSLYTPLCPEVMSYWRGLRHGHGPYDNTAQTANSVSADYDHLTTFFEDLNLFLDRLKVLDGNVPTPKPIQLCLTDILTLILKIVSISIKNMKEKRGLKFLKNLVKGEDKDLIAAYAGLQKLVEQEQRLINDQTLVNSAVALRKLDVLPQLDSKMDESLESTKRIEAQLNELRINAEKSSSVDSLSKIRDYFNPQEVEEYDNNLPFLVEGTATWLFDEPAFRDWMNCLVPILWVSGGPGAGKSFLSTSVINRLTKSQDSMNDTPRMAAYYYFRHNDESKRSVANALAAMVFQLASRDEIFCMHAAATCARSVAISMASVSSLWRNFFLAEYAAGSRSPQLFLVFDGIDEAQRKQITDFLVVISLGLKEQSKIQVLLVGRPELDPVVTSLADTIVPRGMVATIEVSSAKNKMDIMKYIRNKYSRTPNLRNLPAKPYQRIIATTLLEHSNGMFLWVELMFKALEGISQPKLILRSLEVPPKGLAELYERILTSIEANADEAELKTLRELFCWVAHSKRPLRLRELELAIRFITKDEFFECERTILKKCSTLLVLIKKGPVLFEEVAKLENVGSKQSNFAKTEKGLQDREVTQFPENSDGWGDDFLEDLGNDADPIDLELADGAQARETDEYDIYQENVFVELRHASLGDFLLNPAAKPTKLLYSVSQARVHVVISTLRQFTLPEVDEYLWSLSLETWMGQLHQLDEQSVSDDNTRVIVELLLDIFFRPGPAQQRIVNTTRNVGLDHIDFGYNTNPDHPSRVVLLKWFKKGLSPTVSIDAEGTNWIRKLLDQPMMLLTPLCRACVEGLIKSLEESIWLYWICRLGWTLLLSTDLVPPFTPQKDQIVESPEFLKGSFITYLVNAFDVDKGADAHFRIAQALAFSGEPEEAIREYEEAVNLLTEENRSSLYPVLEGTLLEIASKSKLEATKAIELLNQYMELDRTNPRAYTYLGNVHLRQHDLRKAIDAFQKALDLDPGAAEAAFSYIKVMFRQKQYDGICELFTKYSSTITAKWIRSYIEERWFQELLMYAGCVTGKLSVFSQLYESMYSCKYPSDPPQDWGIYWSPQDIAAFCRHWQALMCRKYGGQPDLAFQQWMILFFEDTVFLKLGQRNSEVESELIPFACEQFAELIYERASQSAHPDIDMMSMLERLRRLQAASEAQSDAGYWKMYSRKSLNVLLAQLYISGGRKAEAEQLLVEQFKRGINLLQDDFAWNDCHGYQTLSRVLRLYGREVDAKIALSLRQLYDFDALRLIVEDRNETDDERSDDKEDCEPTSSEPKQETVSTGKDALGPAGSVMQSFEVSNTQSSQEADEKAKKLGPGVFICASGKDCPNGEVILIGEGENASPMYSCNSCIQVDFCQQCFMMLKGKLSGPKRNQFICNVNHKFLEIPIDGWEGVTQNEVMMVHGKQTKIKDWLDMIEADYKSGKMVI